jgi:tetratricopeptide (TPR) repeat protein
VRQHAVFIAFLAAFSLGAGQKDALTRARQLYNQAQYDEAIAAATEARRVAAVADAAGVVLARAHLERYRQSSDAADLTAAHEALGRVDAAKLNARDRVELTLGLGESLYFDDRFGAAAEMFEVALARIDPAGPDAREQVFDWWAGALDRQAQLGPEATRKPSYARIVARSEDELARNATSAVASYWLAAGALGVDDFDRAWSAAEAGWVRAPQCGRASAGLRVDLDRLVRDAIIPERAHARTPQGDPGLAVGAMRAEWEEFKAKWGEPSADGARAAPPAPRPYRRAGLRTLRS